MIMTRSGEVLLTDPPQFKRYWWCGGCDLKEEAPVVKLKTAEEYDMEDWKRANKAVSDE